MAPQIKRLLSFIALIGCFLVLPRGADATTNTYTATFDDRKPVPVVPLLNAVGIYDALYYNSFVLNDAIPLGASTDGLIPASPPNVILTAVEQQATNGTPALTTSYSGSKVTSFDLHSFFFGCVFDVAVGVIDSAEQCTISVAAFRSGHEVAVASYTFTLTTVVNLADNLIKAILPDSFKLLQNVTIIQGDPILQVLALDNVTYTTHL